jgi:hypothetical protein
LNFEKRLFFVVIASKITNKKFCPQEFTIAGDLFEVSYKTNIVTASSHCSKQIYLYCLPKIKSTNLLVLFLNDQETMKNENEINDKIMKITMTIKNDYPELSKYLNEMPVTIPDVSKPEMNNKTLFEYYKSLEAMLKEYVPNH